MSTVSRKEVEKRREEDDEEERTAAGRVRSQSGGGVAASSSSSLSFSLKDHPSDDGKKRRSSGSGGGSSNGGRGRSRRGEAPHDLDDGLVEGEEPNSKAKNSNECNTSNNNSNSNSSGSVNSETNNHTHSGTGEDDCSKNRKRRTNEIAEEEKSPQNYPKKKKEYKAPSSFIADDEFEDILERGWFYMDYAGSKQGPFTTKEMKEWFVAGFFNNEIMVKRISDPHFLKISERDEFLHLERKPTQQNYVPSATFEQIQSAEDIAHNPYYQDFPAVYDPSFDSVPAEVPPPVEAADDSSYAQAAYFTTLKGRFSVDQTAHWKKKGLPMDKDGRMMSHYFDVDAYQEQMRNVGPPKKKKVTKNMIKFYKKRKEDRKRRRILML